MARKKQETIEEADRETEGLSKSAKKRQSTALQKFGEALLELSAESRKKLQLPEEVELALVTHDKLTDKEAARRQRQYIGRLMRELDIRELIKNLDRNAAEEAFSSPAERKRYQQLRAIFSNILPHD